MRLGGMDALRQAARRPLFDQATDAHYNRMLAAKSLFGQP
jgi:hypothetical protein